MVSKTALSTPGFSPSLHGFQSPPSLHSHPRLFPNNTGSSVSPLHFGNSNFVPSSVQAGYSGLLSGAAESLLHNGAAPDFLQISPSNVSLLFLSSVQSGGLLVSSHTLGFSGLVLAAPGTLPSPHSDSL